MQQVEEEAWEPEEESVIRILIYSKVCFSFKDETF